MVCLLILKIILKSIIRKKKLLVIIFATCTAYKIFYDMLSFNNKICLNNYDSDVERKESFYKIAINRLLCFLRFDETEFHFDKLIIEDILITVKHVNRQSVRELKYVYDTWYQFAISQVSEFNFLIFFI